MLESWKRVGDAATAVASHATPRVPRSAGIRIVQPQLTRTLNVDRTGGPRGKPGVPLSALTAASPRMACNDKPSISRRHKFLYGDRLRISGQRGHREKSWPVRLSIFDGDRVLDVAFGSQWRSLCATRTRTRARRDDNHSAGPSCHWNAHKAAAPWTIPETVRESMNRLRIRSKIDCL